MIDYDEVHERVEALLLRLVHEGHADIRGMGSRGQTYTVHESVEIWDELDAAGLYGDNVPWPYTILAVHRSLRQESK